MSEENKRVALEFIDAMGLNDPERASACMAEHGRAVAMGTTRFAGIRPRETMLAVLSHMKKQLTMENTGGELVVGGE